MGQFFLLGLFWSYSVYSAGDACPGNMKQKTAVLSIGFTYPGIASPLGPLQNTISDMAFYQKQMGVNVTKRPRGFTDSAFAGRGKAAFIKMLKQEVKDKEYVLFSYAGHGVPNSKGRWSMVLPGVPNSLLKECKEFLVSYVTKAGRPEKDTKKCESKLDNFLVSDKDLQSVFGDKKVLMFNDSCFSGKADFGKNTTHVAAALSDEEALDSLRGENNGAFTAKIISRYKECHLDQDKDGQMSAQELLTRFASSTPASSRANRKLQPKTPTVLSNIMGPKDALDDGYGKRMNIAPQNISVRNTQEWLSCFHLGPMDCHQQPAGKPESPKPIR